MSGVPPSPSRLMGIWIANWQQFLVTPEIERTILDLRWECLSHFRHIIFGFTPLTAAIRTMHGTGHEWRGMTTV
jgi:hypothetical protein